MRRSYPYVAMYNVNNKFALKQGGWNPCVADTRLKDHTMRDIARPNNDTLYIGCMLDLRSDAAVLELPAFDSKYVSLMVTAYDHYVSVPMPTRLGDFRMPERMLLFSARTEGYAGEETEGVDRISTLNPYWMEPKGKSNLDALVASSVIGPIGLPSEEAEYPPIKTAGGQPMNAMNDCVIRMTSEQLPPAKASWSVTLYDMQNGFFIPDDRGKYSVGENGGMQLDGDGGIEIHVAAEKPIGVPEVNWLPINRKDEKLSLNLRIYVPDQEKMKTWQAPHAVPVN